MKKKTGGGHQCEILRSRSINDHNTHALNTLENTEQSKAAHYVL